MKKVTIDENRRYPKCGSIENQIRVGYNRSGTQRCKCKDCYIRYTSDAKRHAYSEETRQLALKMYYPGKHIRNIHDKSNTFTVEGINADLRHYIPVLARRSRCFPRSPETLKAVVAVFVDAYNQFGLAKFKYRQKRKNGELPFSTVDFL